MRFLPQRATRLPAWVAALVLLVPAVIAQKADITYRDNRGEERTDGGTVESHSFKGVVFKTSRGATRNIAESEIILLKYERVPEEFVAVRTSYREGNYADTLTAADAFVNQKKISTRDRWALQEAYHFAWQAARKLGRFDQAAAYAKQLREAVPDSRYIPAIDLTNAGDLLAVGDFEGAKKAFGQVATAAEANGYDPNYATRAGIGQIEALIEEGKLDDADSALAKLKSSATGEDARNRAEILGGRVLLKRKSIAEAERTFNKVLTIADYRKNPALFAGACNGLGDCAVESGNMDQALTEFSKTFALYHDIDGLDDEVAWAFWRFSLVSKLLATKTEGEAASRHKLNHRRMRQRVAELFIRTRGGQLARAELGLAD